MLRVNAIVPLSAIYRQVCFQHHDLIWPPFIATTSSVAQTWRWHRGGHHHFSHSAPRRVIQLSAGLRDGMLGALSNIPSPYASFEDHCLAARKVVNLCLPDSARGKIDEFRRDPSAPGICLIAGLPVDMDLPSTPLDGNRSVEKRSFISEGCLLGVSLLLGRPFAIASEKGGETIHNICPVRRSESEQSNESSAVDLNLHVENAYFDQQPDFLALYCLRQDHAKQARTYFVDVRKALASLSEAHVAQLQRPVFLVPSPPSHHAAMGGEQWSPPRPVIQSPDDPRTLCHFPGTRALDSQAQQALDRFEELLTHRKNVEHVTLEPGNLLLINNRKVVHGRTVFQSRYDGTDRWLQRVYVERKPESM